MIDIFPLSFILAIFFIYLDRLFSKLGISNLRNTPQTLHEKSVSRFGGAAIFLCLFLITQFSSEPSYSFLKLFLLSSFPIFLVGLVDDLNVIIKPHFRLIVLMISAALCYFLLGTEAYNLEIPILDYFFQFKVFSVVFISFAIAGAVSACNAIDGINGLVKTWFLSALICLLFVSNLSFSLDIYLFFTALFFAVIPIFLFNFPFGKIFLGDGGAYFLGLAISIGLIKVYQSNNLSPWFVLLMLSYPVTDMLVSIIRRMVNRYSALNVDGQHLHHLVLKKVEKLQLGSEKRHHALTTFILFFLYFPFMMIATNFPQDAQILQLAFLFNLTLYLLVYFLLFPRKFLGL